MSYYKKKPVIIEAFQLERRELNWPQWAHDALTGNIIISHNTGKWYNPSEETFLIIRTLEGNHKACLGDYIIKGVKGEIYPCKPDIFEMTYEEAESEEPEKLICGNCNGSGEGYSDGSRCHNCKGSGIK